MTAKRKRGKPPTLRRARAGNPPDLTYRIGYRCPPKHTQFKKGQSGNPSGRPRASETWSTIFAEELARTMSAKVNGKKTEISVLDAIIYVATERAVAGSTPHQILLLRNEYREPPQPLVIFFAEPNDKDI